MNCSRCQEPLDPGAAFCGNCGQPVATAPAQSGAPATTPGRVPAYALAMPHPGEPKAIIGLVLAVLSVPAAIIPFIGASLSVAAIVLATIVMHAHRRLASTGLVFAVIGVLLSSTAIVYNVTHSSAASGQEAASAGAGQQLQTPCFDLAVPTELHISGDTANCKALISDTADAKQATYGYEIDASTNADVTSRNFDAAVSGAAQDIVNSFSSAARRYNLTSQSSGTFAGEQAHYLDLTAPDGTSGRVVGVLHQSTVGYNVFFISLFSRHGTADLSAVERNFTWK